MTDLTQENSQVLMEYGATGKVTNTYSYAEGRVSAIIDGDTYYYLNDGRGSVSELTMTSGSPAVSYKYDIYGKTFASNDDVNNPYQYNAEYTDSTTGLQYLRARYYNANTHRFQTKDTYQGTTAQPITRNNYAYANNNPVNFVDPSGHFPWAVAAIAAGGAIAGAVLGGVSSTYTQYKSTGEVSFEQTARDATIGAVAGAGMAITGAATWVMATTAGASAFVTGAASGMVSGAWGRGATTYLNNEYNPQADYKDPAAAMFNPLAVMFDGIVGGTVAWISSKISYMRQVAFETQKKKYCDGTMANAADDTVANSIGRIDTPNILSNKTLTNQTGKVDNYVSSIKGNEAAMVDFDAMQPLNVRTYSNGTIVGDLPDGRTINIHPSTTLNGVPSLEIYDPTTGKSIKIRY